MLPRTFSLNSCTFLSVLNVVGFFLLARYAEAFAYDDENASFSLENPT